MIVCVCARVYVCLRVCVCMRVCVCDHLNVNVISCIDDNNISIASPVASYL